MNLAGRTAIVTGGAHRVGGALTEALAEQKLEGLSDPARQKALAWLQGMEFPAVDVASLRVDRSGG